MATEVCRVEASALDIVSVLLVLPLMIVFPASVSPGELSVKLTGVLRLIVPFQITLPAPAKAIPLLSVCVPPRVRVEFEPTLKVPLDVPVPDKLRLPVPVKLMAAPLA